MSVLLLDGGMGQELRSRSSARPTKLWSTQVLIDEPDLVRAVHADYFKAGADVATTASYAIHRDRLQPFGLEDRFSDLHHLAGRIAVEERDKHGAGLVAGAMGPLGWSYRPDLAPPVEEAAARYAEIAAIQAQYVDLIICETMSSVDQARGAVMGARQAGKPVWLAVSVQDEDGTRLRSGECLEDVLPVYSEFSLDALLINCSPPEAINQAIALVAGKVDRFGGYANGFVNINQSFINGEGTVDLLQRRTNLDPEVYAGFVDGWVAKGAGVVGGCCEVGPDHIREIARRLRKI